MSKNGPATMVPSQKARTPHFPNIRENHTDIRQVQGAGFMIPSGHLEGRGV